VRLAVIIVALAAVVGLAIAQPDRNAEGIAAFQTVYKVLLSPRCMNCHPAGDAPLQHDDSRPHGQNITRLSETNGLPCSTCHRDKNGTRRGTPPGAPHWHLPPKTHPMIFQGRTPAQLCAQLKDPKETNGKDVAALIEHVDKDALVLWGWAPGPGRTPVPVPHATFVDAMKRWAAAGAPCPDPARM
jgi:hypothetical protein